MSLPEVSARPEEACLLSIIIVTYNSAGFIEECLGSLTAGVGRHPYEVILVDNGSRDGTPELVKQRFPQHPVIENRRNLGFAAANNQGLAQAQGRYLLLLNSDTRVHPGAVDEMVGFLKANPRVAVVGPRLLNPDGTDQGTARAFPTPWAALFGRKSLLTRLFPHNPLSTRYLIGLHRDGATPFPVDSVSGACLMTRREAVEQVGALDDGFFIYWEDIDWCRRFKEQGWQVYCLPQARVMHYEGGSDDAMSPRLIYQFHRSVYRYYVKHHARQPWDPRRLVALVGLSLRAGLLIGTSLLRRPRGSRAQGEPAPASDRAQRLLDLAVALPGLALSSPLILLISLLVRLDSPGPAIFRQERLGKDLKRFTFYKFRTMYADARERFPELYAHQYAQGLDAIHLAFRDDPRVSRVGRLLRRTSLDDLPNLWNVVKGEMALVGPRPEIPEMLPYYPSLAKFTVKPGITGLAQINGRGELSFAETLHHDEDYVRRRSLGLDLKILLATIGAVVRGRGAF